MNSLQLLDILNLGESEDLECKKSKNEVPKFLKNSFFIPFIFHSDVSIN